jgi:hypothetical protein
VLSCLEKLETCRNYRRQGKMGTIKNTTCHKDPSPSDYERIVQTFRVNAEASNEYTGEHGADQTSSRISSVEVSDRNGIWCIGYDLGNR